MNQTTTQLNNNYLHNGYFYLTCNCCDRLISKDEMTTEQYNQTEGTCVDCLYNEYLQETTSLSFREWFFLGKMLKKQR